jgi:hypothetical protein
MFYVSAAELAESYAEDSRCCTAPGSGRNIGNSSEGKRRRLCHSQGAHQATLKAVI